jgi:hypothetical protein
MNSEGSLINNNGQNMSNASPKVCNFMVVNIQIKNPIQSFKLHLIKSPGAIKNGIMYTKALDFAKEVIKIFDFATDIKSQLDHDFFNINVAGVTFKNGDISRQTLLRKIKFQDEPFDKELEVTISQYEYEGEPALSVNINNHQIGNIPKDKVKHILDKWDKVESISYFDVTGGGTKNGEKLNYGAELTIKFNKN